VNEKITKQQLADIYRVKTRTVTNWMYKQRRISFQKIGRMVRFDLEQVEQELAASGLLTPQSKINSKTVDTAFQA
jgi:phage terminase Nu1 subunit (DNA packaging protein)